MPQRISKPAPFERSRTALARFIMLHLTLPTRLAIALTPLHHPWRTLAKSTFDSMKEMTEATLRPRSANGAPAIRVVEQHAPRKRLALTAAMVYLLVAQAIPAMPAVVVYHGPKLYPFKSLGLTEEPVIAPRLRVYVERAVPSEVEQGGREKAPR